MEEERRPLRRQSDDHHFGFYRLPREHHKHLKSTNMLERTYEELARRTHVIRIFPTEESALRLIRALAVEIHEDWIEAHRYLNMEMLREQRKELQLLEALESECDGLFTNRFLWLGASAAALSLRGSGCRNLALPERL